jgi:hypothetical protein
MNRRPAEETTLWSQPPDDRTQERDLIQPCLVARQLRDDCGSTPGQVL